jgi:predicted molibdopterin-dependent oxidoreductase YjgC
VRGLAEQAEATIIISMYGGLAAGWADLVLPGTSYLERDGTFVNLEGRLQRLRRTVEPPCPDELEWIADLAARFGVDVAPYASAVFAEVSEKVYGGLTFGEVGERAPLRGYPEAQEHVSRQALPAAEPKARRGQIRLVAYKPLFSGAAVERVVELQFQRPQAEVELSAHDARRRRIATGDMVTVGSNGSAITLPARVNRRLRAGIARVAIEHANGLGGIVEIEKTQEGVPA